MYQMRRSRENHTDVIKGDSGQRGPLCSVWTPYYYWFFIAFSKVILKFASLAITLLLFRVQLALLCELDFWNTGWWESPELCEKEVPITSASNWLQTPLTSVVTQVTSGPRQLNSQFSCLKATGQQSDHQSVTWLSRKLSSSGQILSPGNTERKLSFHCKLWVAV